MRCATVSRVHRRLPLFLPLCWLLPDLTRAPVQKMGDFVPVPLDDPVLAGGARLVCAQPGDLVLWDSRTVHCNTPALSALRGEGVVEEPAEGSHRKLIRQASLIVLLIILCGVWVRCVAAGGVRVHDSCCVGI